MNRKQITTDIYDMLAKGGFYISDTKVLRQEPYRFIISSCIAFKINHLPRPFIVTISQPNTSLRMAGASYPRFPLISRSFFHLDYLLTLLAPTSIY